MCVCNKQIELSLYFPLGIPLMRPCGFHGDSQRNGVRSLELDRLELHELGYDRDRGGGVCAPTSWSGAAEWGGVSSATTVKFELVLKGQGRKVGGCVG